MLKTTMIVDADNILDVCEFLKGLVQGKDTLVNLTISTIDASISIKSVEEKATIPKKVLLEDRVSLMLQNLGVPLHFKGFTYLQQGILLGIENPDLFKGFVTKVVYPTIAKSQNTTPSGVECCIRRAIDVAWTKETGYIKEFFPCTPKPTQAEFMSIIASKFEKAN